MIATLQAELLEAKRAKEECANALSLIESVEPKRVEEEFYLYLECDSPRFRKKMSGISLAFYIKDKSYKIPWDEQSLKYKFKSERSKSRK